MIATMRGLLVLGYIGLPAAMLPSVSHVQATLSKNGGTLLKNTDDAER